MTTTEATTQQPQLQMFVYHVHQPLYLSSLCYLVHILLAVRNVQIFMHGSKCIKIGLRLQSSMQKKMTDLKYARKLVVWTMDPILLQFILFYFYFYICDWAWRVLVVWDVQSLSCSWSWFVLIYRYSTFNQSAHTTDQNGYIKWWAHSNLHVW